MEGGMPETFVQLDDLLVTLGRAWDGHEVVELAVRRLAVGDGPRARSLLRRSERRASLCWASSSQIVASVLSSRAATTVVGVFFRVVKSGQLRLVVGLGVSVLGTPKIYCGRQKVGRTETV